MKNNIIAIFVGLFLLFIVVIGCYQQVEDNPGVMIDKNAIADIAKGTESFLSIAELEAVEPSVIRLVKHWANDPDSIKVRDVSVIRATRAKDNKEYVYVTAWVNGKNSFNGYTGWQLRVYVVRASTLHDVSDDPSWIRI